MRGDPEAFLLYAQFANRQRDGVFLARNGTILEPGADGSLQEIPRGQGALKTNEVYISQVEGLFLPHLSDNVKAYRLFPLRDLSSPLSCPATIIGAPERTCCWVSVMRTATRPPRPRSGFPECLSSWKSGISSAGGRVGRALGSGGTSTRIPGRTINTCAPFSCACWVPPSPRTSSRKPG
jgi:hypothetical protein